MGSPELVRRHRSDRVAHVVLDRPEAANLVNRAMMTELVDALAEAGRDADVLVVSGAGADFTLGRDQGEAPSGNPREALGRILEANRLLASFPGPVVGLVRGRALGFGSGLVLHCDLAVAGDTAVFGFNEIAHGFPPLIVESYLARYVGEKAALDLVLTGRPVPAWEARSLGMIARVVPDDQLDAAGTALVERLAGLDQRALRAAKSFLRDVVEVPVKERPSYGLEELLRWRGFGNDQ